MSDKIKVQLSEDEVEAVLQQCYDLLGIDIDVLDAKTENEDEEKAASRAISLAVVKKWIASGRVYVEEDLVVYKLNSPIKIDENNYRTELKVDIKNTQVGKQLKILDAGKGKTNAAGLSVVSKIFGEPLSLMEKITSIEFGYVNTFLSVFILN